MWSESLYKLYFKDKKLYQDILNNRISSENTYKFSFLINGNQAFFFFHKEIMKIISNISFLDKQVSIALNKLPSLCKDLYIKKCLIDEILYTNEIEGIISTRKEINEIIANIENNNYQNGKIVSLINKYILLLQNKLDTLKNCFDIRALYDNLVFEDIVLSNVSDMPDGLLFRNNQVQVLNENSGKVMHDGVMPESKIIAMLLDILNILNDDSVEPLIRIAIFHYGFSYIHPFYYGNGRTNRFISSMYLRMFYDPIISFRLSLTISENKKQYYDSFNYTNSKYNMGDITTFVYEFVSIIEKSFNETIKYLSNKQDMLNYLIDKIDSLELECNEKKILTMIAQVDLFKGENNSIKEIAVFVGLSEPTTRKALTGLIDKMLITEEKKSKFKVYSLSKSLLE